MSFFFGYSENKIKPYLKMAIQRIKISNNKRITSVKHQKREISQLLAEHKDEKAKIKVEHIIRDDFVIEGYEILELYLELLHERIRQITNSNECPEDLIQSVSSLIWAANNVDIEELSEVKNQLVKKFGSKFANNAINYDGGDLVNPRLYQKLTYSPPSKYLVLRYLQEIAKAYQVDWNVSEAELLEAQFSHDRVAPAPTGSSVQMAVGSSFGHVYLSNIPTVTSDTSDSGAAPKQERVMDVYERAEFDRFQQRKLSVKDDNPPYNPSLSQLSALPPPTSMIQSNADDKFEVNNSKAGGQVIDNASDQSNSQIVQQEIPVVTAEPIDDNGQPMDPILALQARLSALNKSGNL
eukprot:gene11303-15163_t